MLPQAANLVSAPLNMFTSKKTKEKNLIVAAGEGDVDKVRSLLDHHGVNLNCTGSYGDTPLREACVRDRDEVVRLLITRGADIDPKDVWQRTPLHYTTGSIKCARYLLDNNANVNSADENGVTPLYKACGLGKEDLARLLLSHGGTLGSKVIDFECTPGIKELLKPNRLLSQAAQEMRNVTLPITVCFQPETPGDSFEKKAYKVVPDAVMGEIFKVHSKAINVPVDVMRFTFQTTGKVIDPWDTIGDCATTDRMYINVRDLRQVLLSQKEIDEKRKMEREIEEWKRSEREKEEKREKWRGK
eukprot:TRINITY_DN13376_c0_g1_i1.p1 TRINITY_DN13376_c0_g1~~TRINITY_DN13376_c0_g1_i1.p1  ORF type:complete len:301 (+),score=47.98 TRINITY_DN13376_c0_g1_i1:479-1381(+)